MTMFALLIVTRILFIASIVFIIGYVFGGFAKRKSLRTITRIAAITLIIVFIALNILIVGSHRGRFNCPWNHQSEQHRHAPYSAKDARGHWEYSSDSAR